MELSVELSVCCCYNHSPPPNKQLWCNFIFYHGASASWRVYTINVAA